MKNVIAKLSLIVGIIISLSACMPDYSEGYRTGTIQNFSYKGTVLKSWEGLLDQGGMKADKDEFGNRIIIQNAIGFNVSKDDQELIDKLIDAQEKRIPVTIHYKQWLVKPISIENERVVVSVK